MLNDTIRYNVYENIKWNTKNPFVQTQNRDTDDILHTDTRARTHTLEMVNTIRTLDTNDKRL